MCEQQKEPDTNTVNLKGPVGRGRGRVCHELFCKQQLRCCTLTRCTVGCARPVTANLILIVQKGLQSRNPVCLLFGCNRPGEQPQISAWISSVVNLRRDFWGKLVENTSISFGNKSQSLLELCTGKTLGTQCNIYPNTVTGIIYHNLLTENDQYTNCGIFYIN